MTILPSATKFSRERDFQHAMVASYKRAKDHQRLVFFLSYVSTGLAAVGALNLPEWGALTIFMTIVCLQIGCRLFSRSSRAAYSRGETLRREHRQLDALGQDPSPRSLHDLPAPSERLDLGAVTDGRVYYNTQAQLGPSRLVDSLAQSALQTELIAKRGAQENCFAFFAFWILSSLSIIMLSSLPDGILTFHVYQAALALLAGMTLSTPLEAWLAYKDLNVAARECADRFIALRGGTGPSVQAETQRWMSIYDCALAAAPVLPDRLWMKTERIANEKWERVLAGQKLPGFYPPQRGSP